MTALGNLSESQVITVCVIGAMLVLFPLAAVVAGLVGVLHRKA